MKLLEDQVHRPSLAEILNHRLESESWIWKLAGDKEVHTQEPMRRKAIGEEIDPGAVDAEQKNPIVRPRPRLDVRRQLLVRPG
jgi:hypothetical protein